jgi:hypothetical protein
VIRVNGSQYGVVDSSSEIPDSAVIITGSLRVLAASNCAPALYAAASPLAFHA